MIEPVYEKGYPCWDAVNNKGKYAVMVPFESGWLYVTGFDSKVVTYDKKYDAENAAKIFNGSKVVEYKDE